MSDTKTPFATVPQSSMDDALFHLREMERSLSNVVNGGARQPAYAFGAVPRTRTLGDEARETDGALGELLEVMAENRKAARGVAVQRAISGFGAWMRRMRDARHLTLEQLAAAAGTTPAQISLIERGLGRRGPSLDLIARILNALDLELDFPESEKGEDPA